jgi:hypothetical protein
MQDIKFPNSVILSEWLLSKNQLCLLFMKGKEEYDIWISDIEKQYWASRGITAIGYSHVQMLGCNNKVYESTVDLTFKKFAWGVISSSVYEATDDWKTNELYAAMFFPTIDYLTWNLITQEAEKGVGKIMYNFTGLLGVWWTITKYKLTHNPKVLLKNNPMDSKNSNFCCQYIDNNFINGDKINLVPDTNPDETTVDSLWLSKVLPTDQYNILQG